MPEEKFEESLQVLEELVTKLERGEVTLDEALASYERGIKLVRRCYSLLETAEKKIEKLMANSDGSFSTEEVEVSEAGEPVNTPRKKRSVKKSKTAEEPPAPGGNDSMF
jgi:exodeoxyribonuclease VII small subunit